MYLMKSLYSIFVDDHSRINLKPLASDGNGYINANFIEASAKYYFFLFPVL